jgi:hypothetical protein
MTIRIKLKTIRIEEDDIVLIMVKTMYGIVNLKFEVPFLDIVFINNKPALKYKAKIESNKTNKLLKRISKIFTVDDINNLKKYLHHDPVFIRKMKNYWSKKMIIRDFSLIIKYGTEDAALTALLYGLIWALTGSMIALLNNNLKFNTKDIVITPYFDQTNFSVEFSCIIQFKFGDIINTGIMLYRRRIQRKKIKQELNNTLNAT